MSEREMSESEMSESENESELDFSASEDEYVPSDSESDDYQEKEEVADSESDDYQEVVEKPSSSKTLTKVKRKATTRQSTKDDDDSDSSVENYLVNPNEIDLASDFFDPNKIVVPDAPKFDCNVGLKLSDSDEEVFDDVPSTSKAAAVKLFDFQQNTDHRKALENVIQKLSDFRANNYGLHEDVTKLLAIGEPSLAPKKSSQSKRKEVLSSSDESDFEEVEEEKKADKKSDVEVRIGPAEKKKPNKLQAEIEASIKRKINRRKKENQLMMHKVHLLSWIAYGNYVNKILNSTKLMEMVVKYIPSDKSYPKDKTDQKYFEQISRWFKTTVGLKSNDQNCSLKCLPPIATSLALQIQSKMAICKKDFVFIFIILLRSMGIQCRLVINLATVPIRPAAKDLCVITTKTTEKSSSSDKAKTGKKSTKSGKVSDKDKNAVKDSASTKSKLNSRTSSISGTKSEIVIKGRETSNQKKSLKTASTSASSQSQGGERKNLKRSVSVQSSSAVNVNNKRSRIQSSSPSKANNAPKPGSSTQNGSMKIAKTRSTSGQEATSTTSKLSKQKSVQSSETGDTNVVVTSISNRTRKGIAKKPSVTSTSHTIPQLDGGNDKKKQKSTSNLYKIRLPLRRSVSASSTSVAVVSPSRGRAKSNAPTLRLPSMSRAKSKSPTSTSEHVSRKSQFEKTKPNDSSPSSSKIDIPSMEQNNPKSIRPESKSPTAPMAKRGKRPLYTSPTKGNFTEESTSGTEPKDTKSIPEDRKASQTKSAATSKRSNPKTKSSNPDRKLRSTSTEPTSIKAATVSATKSTESSKQSNARTKSSDRTAASSSKSSEQSKSISSSTSKQNAKPVKRALKRKATKSVSSDSDFAPTPKKKLSPAVDKPLPKQVERLKKRIDRRILSTDDESVEAAVKKDDMNYWIEVYCEAESKWLCIDLFKMKVNCVDEIKKKASKPIAYVFAWNNNNKIKDVSPRYCSQWNTTTRKLRVQPDWLGEALCRYREPLSQRCVAEDRELEEIHAQTPIPKSISELKNHPLYVLSRHLLKFEGIYPPNPVAVGFIRDEPIYSRLCVHTLRSREIWVKQARVVKPGEVPYKIVKARPKWDRLANKMLEPQPLELFGRWQTGPYEPPTAENGIVPRNAYGNVELFKPEMLPKKTVHLRLAGLNRVCAKLKIDCVQAVVGFDYHGGSSHPTFDGFVVCEEFAELVTERWCEEQEESYRKAKEKQNQRVYDNWKKLVKGLFIRERLQRKYNFAGKGAQKDK